MKNKKMFEIIFFYLKPKFKNCYDVGFKYSSIKTDELAGKCFSELSQNHPIVLKNKDAFYTLVKKNIKEWHKENLSNISIRRKRLPTKDEEDLIAFKAVFSSAIIPFLGWFLYELIKTFIKEAL